MLGIIEQQRATGDYTFIIGIDLGEDFTGVCYALRNGDPSSANVLSTLPWPYSVRDCDPRIPTCLLYMKIDDEDGYKLRSWGHCAKNTRLRSGQLYFSFSNLFSVKDTLLKSEYGEQFPIKRLVADFLKKKVSFVKKDISINYPQYQDHSACYCIAIPTTWNEDARGIIHEAAIAAGMIKPTDEAERLILINEREAVIADLCHPNEYFSVQDNKTIAVCNIGEVTIDVLTYKALVEGGNTYLEELTTNHTKTGGSHIDKLAKLWIQVHLDQQPYPAQDSDIDAMVQCFRNEIKMYIGNDNDEDQIFIPVSNRFLRRHLRDSDFIEDGMLKITLQQMLTYIFDPIINHILKMIDEQLTRTPGIIPDNLFLVGGFSSCRYLYKRIEQEFLKTGRVRSVHVPLQPALSSARGAVHHGLNPSIVFYRAAHRSYAIQCNKKFRDGIDNPANLLIRPNGQRRCENRLDFFVTKNTKMDISYHFEREYSAIYPNNTLSILYSFDGEGDSLPDYVDSNGVEEVIRFNVEMPVIPGKKDGDKVPYKTRIHIGHTKIKIEVLIGGETQVHTVNISGQQPQPLVKGEMVPGYDEMINYFRQKGFKATKYSEEKIRSRYLLEPLDDKTFSLWEKRENNFFLS